MANVRKITLPDSSTLNIVDSRLHVYRNATGTAAVTATPFTSAKWDVTDNQVTAYEDGMIACVKVPVAGNATYGTVFQINNLGYKPVVYDKNSGISTRYSVGGVVWAVYNSTQTASGYLNSASASTITGCWQVMDYNVDTTYTNVKLGQGYATCTTAASTTAKTASLTSYTLTAGGIVAVNFSNDVPAGATLNINSKGAKAIYHRGAAITAGVIKGGDTAYFMYNTYYHLLGVDRIITNVSDLTNDAGYTTNVGTITSVGNTSSGDVAVVNGGNTASFGNAVTVGTVGGVDLTFTMPSAPSNSDEKVKQSPSTTNSAFEILLSGTADNTERTEGAKKSSTLKYNPSTKALVTGGTVDGYTLNAAAGKAVDSSITADSTSTNLPTSAAVASALSDKQNVTLETTWSALKTLRDNGTLQPGRKYRITDYVATTTYVESQSANHPFDIIVTALTASKLSEEVEAALHSGDSYFASTNFNAWKVLYCIDNDTTRFAWADSTNGKGVIYRLIDEWNNDLPYDFKGIQFKRYKVTPKSTYTTSLSDLSGLYIGMPPYYGNGTAMQGLDYDSNDYHWYYTFNTLPTDLITPTDASLVGTHCNNNKFNALKYSNGRQLNNIVICGGTASKAYFNGKNNQSQANSDTIAVSNMFHGDNQSFITVLGLMANNNGESQFRNSIIVGAFRHNYIRSDFENNVLAGFKDICFNNFGTFHENVVCSVSFLYNTINAGFLSNNIFGEFSNNTIMSGFQNNSISALMTQCFTGCLFAYNTISNAIKNCYITGTQFSFNTVAAQMNSCNANGIVSYISIPSNTNMFANVDFKNIRGTSGSLIAIDYSEFFLSAITGVKRRVVIEGTTDGKVVATWRTTDGALTGVYKLPTATTWTALPSGVTVDANLDTTSSNPVQNSTVATVLNNKAALNNSSQNIIANSVSVDNAYVNTLTDDDSGDTYALPTSTSASTADNVIATEDYVSGAIDDIDSETWTFTLTNNQTVTKTVLLK